MKPHIKQFFHFLEKKESKRAPLRVKLLNLKDFNLSPEDLYIKGNLNLAGTSITFIPDNLTVEGNLYLDETEIESLPGNLIVKWNLWLEDTPLAQKYTKEQIRSMIEEKGGSVGNVVT
jgi:hypothetical protein